MTETSQRAREKGRKTRGKDRPTWDAKTKGKILSDQLKPKMSKV